jgi:hypothetical protein
MIRQARCSELVEASREARLSAVRLLRLGRVLEMTCLEVAGCLGVRAGTLRKWEGRWRETRLAARPLGRPACRAVPRAQRQAVLWALHATSGKIGVDQLMLLAWPPVPRSAIVDLKARWRYAAHRRGGKICGKVEWLRAGAVWALDWTEPEEPIEGIYTRVLVVRDLASGRNLLSWPCLCESGKVAVRALERLIAKYGPPGLLKRDNGKSLAFDGIDLLSAYHGILVLNSPPACPGYNGACEAGIGSLKVAADHLAAAAGRDLEWACDDVERAREQVNARVQRNGLSADDRWSARRPFCPRERESLWGRYREHEARERAARGIDLATRLEPFEQASVDRRALARALEEEGLVRFRRRWIRPPIRGRKVSRKT